MMVELASVTETLIMCVAERKGLLDVHIGQSASERVSK